MAREGHLDAELYELFLRSGTCLAYAKRFMPADQIDVEDVSAYLS